MQEYIPYLAVALGGIILGAITWFKKSKPNKSVSSIIVDFVDIIVSPSPKNEEELKSTRKVIESAEETNRKAKELLKRMKDKYKGDKDDK